MAKVSFLQKEKLRADFALKCRKVRLYLRDHPGCTTFEMNRDLGFKTGNHLMKMQGMGIVACTNMIEEGGRRRLRWDVVPQ